MLHNYDESGEPNPSNTEKYLISFKYNLLNKHIDYSDQQMGPVHPERSDRDVKCIKICTIILIGMMTSALKVLAMFTLSMGTLILECYLPQEVFTLIQVKGPHLTIGDPLFCS